MNINGIIQEIEQADHKVFGKISLRRDALKNFGSKVAFAALPFSLGSIFNTKDARASVSVTETLNKALELEYFEYEFYHTANNSPGLIPEASVQGFIAIEAHEKAHVEFLTKTIASLGGTPYTRDLLAPHDFTRGGVYPVFTDYSTFLMTAQSMEDAGIRAHVGRLEDMKGMPEYAKIQQLVTVEARHSAFIKMERNNLYPFKGVEVALLSRNLVPHVNFAGHEYVGKREHQHLGKV